MCASHDQNRQKTKAIFIGTYFKDLEGQLREKKNKDQIAKFEKLKVCQYNSKY